MVAELMPEEVARRLKEAPKTLVLLDVREPFERQMAVVEPSLHIPMREVASRLGEIPRDRTVVVYCHSGGRSATVAAYLEHHGFGDVANLTGGIDRWSREVDPDVPRYG
jgi:sulfur-carrier protein adenylyltransferase/sulfurtransferase